METMAGGLRLNRRRLNAVPSGFLAAGFEIPKFLEVDGVRLGNPSESAIIRKGFSAESKRGGLVI
jgi:hypothetical protein